MRCISRKAAKERRGVRRTSDILIGSCHNLVTSALLRNPTLFNQGRGLANMDVLRASRVSIDRACLFCCFFSDRLPSCTGMYFMEYVPLWPIVVNTVDTTGLLGQCSVLHTKSLAVKSLSLRLFAFKDQHALPGMMHPLCATTSVPTILCRLLHPPPNGASWDALS